MPCPCQCLRPLGSSLDSGPRAACLWARLRSSKTPLPASRFSLPLPSFLPANECSLLEMQEKGDSCAVRSSWPSVGVSGTCQRKCEYVPDGARTHARTTDLGCVCVCVCVASTYVRTLEHEHEHEHEPESRFLPQPQPQLGLSLSLDLLGVRHRHRHRTRDGPAEMRVRRRDAGAQGRRRRLSDD